VNTKNSTNILPYAQKVFEQAYRGKTFYRVYSVLEYLSNPILWKELEKDIDCLEPPQVINWEEELKEIAYLGSLWRSDSRRYAETMTRKVAEALSKKFFDPACIYEIIVTYRTFIYSFVDKRVNFCDKRKSEKVLTKEELITEEDIIKLIDCAVLAQMVGDWDMGITSTWQEISILSKVKYTTEVCCFAEQYLSEIISHITENGQNHFLI